MQCDISLCIESIIRSAKFYVGVPEMHRRRSLTLISAKVFLDLLSENNRSQDLILLASRHAYPLQISLILSRLQFYIELGSIPLFIS